MSENKSNFGQWLLLSAGALGASLSLILVLSPVVKAATATAQCNADEYVDCWGGVRCTATDDVGCACYDSQNRVVMKHSCSELGEPILD